MSTGRDFQAACGGWRCIGMPGIVGWICAGLACSLGGQRRMLLR
jgi:hypothetical protein